MAEIKEIELEDFLFSMAKKYGSINHGCLHIKGDCFRQVSLDGYGIADLILIDLDPESQTLFINIIELKKDCIDLKSVGQICRYKVGLERFLNKTIGRIKYLRRFSVEINCHLVGRKYIGDDTCFVVDTMPDLYGYLYSIDLNTGIIIEESSGWFNNRENFKAVSKIIRGLRHSHRATLTKCFKSVLEMMS